MSQTVGRDLLLGYFRICLVANFLCFLVGMLKPGQGLGHSDTEDKEEVVGGLHLAAGQIELRIERAGPVFIVSEKPLFPVKHFIALS